MQAATTLSHAENPKPPRTPAPLWHTALVILFFTVPLSWVPGVATLFSGLHGIGRLPAYFIEFELQWLIATLVCVGFFLHNTSLSDVIGKPWRQWKDLREDIGLALSYWFVAMAIAFFLSTVGRFSHIKGGAGFMPANRPELLGFLLVAISAGITEEIIFRGYLQKQIYSISGNMPLALFIQAAVFAAAHGYDQTLIGYTHKFSLGLLLGALANSRKSLLPAILCHAWFDAFLGILAAWWR